MIFFGYLIELPKSLPQLSVTSLYYVAFIFISFCLARPFKSILRPYILLIANIIFLYSFSLFNLYFILAFALYSYIIAFIVDKKRNIFLLLFTILPVILILAYFKYAGILNINNNLMMPLGLSFYSFKIISYLVDVYKKEVELEKNIIYYLDYVLFFPCITAGPINKAKPFLKEIRNKEEFDYRDAKNGGFQLMLGIFEKIVLCDYIAYVCNLILNNNALVGMNKILGVILYSFNIYLDFDAISNIAIGSARLLGFHLPKNFNTPYLASTLKEFWERWHISLSTWLKDYIYIPLGGSKNGNVIKYINIMLVFLVSGFWHGSTINFIIWGLLHGLIRVIEEIILSPFENKINNKFVLFILRIFGIGINFIIVTLLWLIFRYQNMQEVFNVLNLCRQSSPLNFELIGLTRNETIWLFVVLAITIILDILRNHFDMLEVYAKQFILFRWIIYACLIAIFIIFGVYGGSFDPSDFIYQWF